MTDLPAVLAAADPGEVRDLAGWQQIVLKGAATIVLTALLGWLEDRGSVRVPLRRGVLVVTWEAGITE